MCGILNASQNCFNIGFTTESWPILAFGAQLILRSISKSIYIDIECCVKININIVPACNSRSMHYSNIANVENIYCQYQSILPSSDSQPASLYFSSRSPWAFHKWPHSPTGLMPCWATRERPTSSTSTWVTRWLELTQAIFLSRRPTHGKRVAKPKPDPCGSFLIYDYSFICKLRI